MSSKKPIGFWGLVMEPGKMYSQEVPVSFRITMATLGPDAYRKTGEKPSRTHVMLTHQKDGEFALCSLRPENNDQQALDMVFLEGETIHLRVDGENSVHLTGYYVDDLEERDPYAGYDSEELDAELNGEDIVEETEDDEEADSEEEEETDEEMADFIDDSDMSTGVVDSDDESVELEDEETGDDEDDENEDDDEESPRFKEITFDEEEDEDDEEYDSEDDKEYDSEECDSDECGSEEYDSEIDPEMDSEIDSDEAGSVDMSSKARKVIPVTVPVKKIKVETSPEAKKEQKESAPQKTSPQKTSPNKEATPKKENASVAASAAASVADSAADSGATPKSVSKTLPSGLQIEDVKVGAGIKAQKSRKVDISYVATGEDGKPIKGAGKELSFSLGDSKVLKAIGIGITGMALGGVRKLIVPATMIEDGVQPPLPKKGNVTLTITLEKVQAGKSN